MPIGPYIDYTSSSYPGSALSVLVSEGIGWWSSSFFLWDSWNGKVQQQRWASYIRGSSLNDLNQTWRIELLQRPAQSIISIKLLQK